MKAHFITRFDATLLDERTRAGRRLWRLNSPLMFYSMELGVVVEAPAGYITDLNSCPRWPVIYWLAGDVANEASGLHDYVYSLKLFPREVCDRLLKEAALATHTPLWQANIIYAGVRVGGANHYGGLK